MLEPRRQYCGGMLKALRYETRKTRVMRSTIELWLLSTKGLDNHNSKGTVIFVAMETCFNNSPSSSGAFHVAMRTCWVKPHPADGQIAAFRHPNSLTVHHCSFLPKGFAFAVCNWPHRPSLGFVSSCGVHSSTATTAPYSRSLILSNPLIGCKPI